MLKSPEIYSKELRKVPMLPISSPREEKMPAPQRRERFHLLKQLTRFGLVGSLNTLIDILALNLLLLFWPTTSTLHLLCYNALAYAVGAGNSFVCNKYWTFKQRQRVTGGELMRFSATTLLALVLNSFMLWLAGLALASFQLNATLWTNASKVLAISATMLVSYLGMRLWVFASKGQRESANLSVPEHTRAYDDISTHVTMPLHYNMLQNYTVTPRVTRGLPADQARLEQRHFPGVMQMSGSTGSLERITPLSTHKDGKDGAVQRVTGEQGTSFHGHYSLSVVMPAYNEEGIIAQTLITAREVLSSWQLDFEILAVNDGSADHTGEIIARLAALHPQVRLINHQFNQGYGAALVSGFQAATKELTFFMDSDGQFDIRALRSFFPFIESYDAVLGYRIKRQDTWMRKLNAWGCKMLVRMTLGVHLRDIDCAFKLFHTSFLHDHPIEIRPAMINARTRYKLKRGGYSQREVGVPHLPRMGGRATGARPSVIARALRDLFICTRRWESAEKISIQQRNRTRHQP